jgi:hypothetical protein
MKGSVAVDFSGILCSLPLRSPETGKSADELMNDG